MQVNPDDIAFSIRTLVFVTVRRQAAWSAKQVAERLRELLAAGIVFREDYGMRAWVTVAERFRYEKGSRPHEGPPAPAQQSEAFLPMALPPPDLLRPKSHIPVTRIEEEIKNDSGTRAKCRDGLAQAGKFVRSEDDADDPIWQDLCRFLNPDERVDCAELINNGAGWLKILKADRVRLGIAVRECADKARRETINNRGAALNNAYARQRKTA
ncbi:MAG: hypothetical protein NTU84_00540 [Verrucomicrobia bacterium]|nr:hypothetical protein [Verrucomicrobiota bacterium]